MADALAASERTSLERGVSTGQWGRSWEANSQSVRSLDTPKACYPRITQ